MTEKRRDDEITRALIADASNPDAWERVAIVPPSTSPRPDWYGKSHHPKEERFEAIYRKYCVRVFHYFRTNRIGDDEAHDLSQDTFKRLYERMGQIRNDDPWPFVATIAKTVLLNRVRARQTQERSARMVEIDDPELLLAEPVAPPEPDYADRQAEETSWERVRKAVASLPPGQRESLRLWIEGFQYNEITEILGITMDAVKSRLRDAKRLLREQLGETR